MLFNCRLITVTVFWLLYNVALASEKFQKDRPPNAIVFSTSFANAKKEQEFKYKNTPSREDDEDFSSTSSGNGRVMEENFGSEDLIPWYLGQVCEDNRYKEKMSCLKGQQGNPGQNGANGPPGPVGLPGNSIAGEKGDSVQGPVGPQGPNGNTGEPGISQKGEPGLKGEKGDGIQKIVHGRRGPPGRQGFKGASSAIIYNNLMELRKMENHTKVGVIAYVNTEKKFYGRIMDGWAPFIMGEAIAWKQSLKKNYQNYQPYRPYIPKHRRRPYPKQPFIALKPKRSTLRLVALNDPWTGNMNGIDHINFQCQKEAYEAKVKGLYRAFLSSREMDLKSIVKNPKDLIINLMNKTVYTSWTDVFNRRVKLWNPEEKLFTTMEQAQTETMGIYSFNGKNVITDEHWEMNLIWHGTFEDGKGSFTKSCKSWTSNNESLFGLASDFLYKFMLDQQKERCNSSLIVLCIEVPPYLANKYEAYGLGLPDGVNKTYDLSLDHHKRALEKYDEDWAHLTNPPES